MNAEQTIATKPSTNGAKPGKRTARRAAAKSGNHRPAPPAETPEQPATVAAPVQAEAPAPSPAEVVAPPAATAPVESTASPAPTTEAVKPSAETAPEGTETPAKPSVPHVQNMAHFELVSQVRVQIDSVRALDPVLAALLAERGVTEEYLIALESQLEVTDQSIDARQDAIQTEQRAIDAMELGFAAAYDQVVALRQVSRTVLAADDDGTQTQIFLCDPLPRRIDLFLPVGRRTLEGAQAEPLASLLATAAYPPAAVEAALTSLSVLEQLAFARQQARYAAIQATEVRNRTVRDLRRAVRPLRVQMRSVLRRHPEFGRPVGF